MISNAPLEQLITCVMALDALPPGADHGTEVRCLMRKIAWVAGEAEAVVQRAHAERAADDRTGEKLGHAA